jgi:hypothetical protein
MNTLIVVGQLGCAVMSAIAFSTGAIDKSILYVLWIIVFLLIQIKDKH